MSRNRSKVQSLTPKVLRIQALWMVALAAVGSFAAFGQSTNAPTRLTFDAFRMVSDRNIFNPNRYARSSGRTAPRTSSQPAARVESISLVGVLAYDKGYYAFFDGTSSAYKQAIQAGGTIGQYHVTQVAPELVRLVAGTNAFDLKVGMQMRREDEGDWFLSEGGDAPRKRIVSTRSRTRGGVRGDSSGSGGSEETMEGSEPEVIVLEGDSQNQNETPAVEPAPNGNGNGNGEGGGASTAEAGDSGETDPVLRALMERRRNALNR
jgi:hypothetical protein